MTNDLLTPDTFKYTFCAHLPSAGLEPREIGDDPTLIRELVIRARVMTHGFECLADDRSIRPNNLYNISPYTLTTDSVFTVTPLAAKVSAQDLLIEIQNRAEQGSIASAQFLEALPPVKDTVDAVICLKVHDAVKLNHDRVRRLPDSDDGEFWKDLHRGHTSKDLAALDLSRRPEPSTTHPLIEQGRDPA